MIELVGNAATAVTIAMFLCPLPMAIRTYRYMVPKSFFRLLRRVIFLNDTELLRLPRYQIKQTIAQSKRLDDYTSGKPKKNIQKIFRLRNF